MKIVKMNKAHVKELVAIGKTHWSYENWITKEFLLNTLHDKGYHFTAVDNGKVVGGIMVLKEDDPKMWLFYFVVAKELQRKGIGTLLLKKALSRMEKGTLLFVDLTPKDKSGMSFYRKNGFKVKGRIRDWFERARRLL